MGSQAGLETRLGVQCVRLAVQTDHVAKRSVMITDLIQDKRTFTFSEHTFATHSPTKIPKSAFKTLSDIDSWFNPQTTLPGNTMSNIHRI